MNLQSLPTLLYAVLLFQFYISYGKNECHGPPESVPCKCHIEKYECLYFKCSWESSKCSDSPDTDFPTFQPTPQPIDSDIPDTYQFSNHIFAPKSEKQIQTDTTTTDFPTYQPTPEPADLDYKILECGDSINNKYEDKDLIFELNILYDTTMVEINACNSNYGTTLKLFDGLNEDTPIFSDDNSCQNEYDSSLIKIPNGLNKGTYYLLLSADNGLHRQHGQYELHLFCETEAETYAENNGNINQNQKTECESNCDAFNVQMLYFGPLSDYNTANIYYDKIDTNHRRLQSNLRQKYKSKRRRTQQISDNLLSPQDPTLTSKRLRKMQDDHNHYYGYHYDMNYNYDYPRYRQAIGFKTASPAHAAVNGNLRRMMDNNVTTTATKADDIMCYTYRVERLFNNGICSDKLNSIVLGVCNMDYNRINYKDLDELIVKEYGGNLYNGYNNFGINEITGVEIDVPVDENIEFTLCMRGVNNKGNVSHNVQFERGTKGAYVCHDQTNDGLPCLDRPYRNNEDVIDFAAPGEKEDKHAPESKAFPRILQVVLLMVMISALYVFINNKAKKSAKKDKSNTKIDWVEINVSDTLSDTEDVNDDKDPLDLTDDIIYNKILSPASTHNDNNKSKTNMIETPIDENDNIADLKENLFDLNKKFLNNQNDNRSSVSSNVSENDGCTILPVDSEYNHFDNVVSDDGYWNSRNADIFSNDEISPKNNT